MANEINCKWCGKNFTPHYHNVKFCSNECRNAAKKQRQKNYYISNREKLNAQSQEYYRTHKDQINQWKREYYQTHKEKHREWNKKYYQTHKGEFHERNKKYYQTHKEYYEKRKFNLNLCGDIYECLNCSKERCVYEV